MIHGPLHRIRRFPDYRYTSPDKLSVSAVIRKVGTAVAKSQDPILLPSVSSNQCKAILVIILEEEICQCSRNELLLADLLSLVYWRAPCLGNKPVS